MPIRKVFSAVKSAMYKIHKVDLRKITSKLQKACERMNRKHKYAYDRTDL